MAYEFSRAKESLSTIAVLKQDIYEYSFKVFDELNAAVKRTSDYLSKEVSENDRRVEIEFKDVNRNEFWLYFGSDVLIFSLHSNVFSFDHSHSFFQTNYIAEDHSRAYFCMIEVFNFLRDSVKYNRYRDVGEMVCRIFINKEKKFFIEGMGAMGSLFTDLANQEFNTDYMNQIIETCITTSVQYDLWAPPFNDVRFITFQEIMEKNGDSPVAPLNDLDLQLINKK